MMSAKHPRGRPAYPDVLTPSEWRVAEAVRHGLTNRAIAERQGVSTDAVKFHVFNILTKLGMARRAELRRWQGVRNDSNLVGAGAMAEFESLGSIGQISRSAKDIDAATAWYRDVLGLPLLYAFEKLAFFDCSGVRLMLAEGDEPAQSILYFQVTSIHTAHAELSARGAEFVAAPHLIHRHANGTEEWMAFFSDNEGRPLAIMAQIPTNGD